MVVEGYVEIGMVTLKSNQYSKCIPARIGCGNAFYFEKIYRIRKGCTIRYIPFLFCMSASHDESACFAYA